MAVVSFDAPADVLLTESAIRLEHFETRDPDCPLDPYAETYPFSYSAEEVPDLDSSVERLQVKVDGLNGERYAVTCNGRRLSLHPTGARGQFIAGVRYRAWQPPSCLHPTIPVHAPLVFDIVDTGVATRSADVRITSRIRAVVGRSYETFPVNANEAEARRAARFVPFGHTPGPFRAPAREANPCFPMTLDLRRSPSDGGNG